VLFVVGGAALAAGGYLLITTHDNEAPVHAALAPVVTPTHVGLAFGGSF
jgi:hypothetical protein